MHRQVGQINETSITIDGKIHHRKKGERVNILFLTHSSHRLVSKAQVDAEAPQTLQNVIIVFDKGNHLIVSLIYLLIAHITSIPSQIFIMFVFLRKIIYAQRVAASGIRTIYQTLVLHC